MTVLMFFMIYFGSVVLLCSYNFIHVGTSGERIILH